jgi:N-acyl-D-amino-acid deacylase
VFLLISVVVVSACRLEPVAAEGRQAYPITGKSVVGLEKFEQKFSALLQSNAIPGASLAIAKNGKLVYARGFGWANLETQEAVQPNSLFRIASISKSLTAVATLLLCQQQKLHLDQNAFDLLSGLTPCCLDQREHRAGGAAWVGEDSRISNITIRHLLNMTSGWQRLRSGDPIFSPTIGAIARRCSVTMRPDPKSIIRYVLSKPLDAYPGKDYAYGNIDYLVLGEVIRKASNQSYEEYVRNSVLKPLGITRMKLGKTLLTAEHEVRYYGCPGEETFESLYPNIGRRVRAEYGGMFALESAPASIGWIASSIDLLKFITALSGERSIDSLLQPDSFYRMLSIPLSASIYKKSEYPNECFAMGWEVDPANKPGEITFFRHGSLDGTMSFVMHRADGVSWSVLFNSRPAGYLDVRRLANETIADGVSQQAKWPAEDLFEVLK